MNTVHQKVNTYTQKCLQHLGRTDRGDCQNRYCITDQWDENISADQDKYGTEVRNKLKKINYGNDDNDDDVTT